MFNLLESIKKRLFRDVPVRDEEKSIQDFSFNDSLHNVLSESSDIRDKAQQKIAEMHDTELMLGSELDELIDEEVKKIRQQEEMEYLKKKKALRTIKTLRMKEDIQEAVDSGQKILQQDVEPSKLIRVTDVYLKDTDTGEVYTRPDCYSTIIEMDRGNIKFIKKKTYYPYTFPSKIAAYVLPDGLRTGERVILQDLIEDIVGSRHAWGRYRLESAEAIWNGERFIVDSESYDVEVTMG